MGSNFRFNQGVFDFGLGERKTIDFVQDEDQSATDGVHFSLLLGANGTFKSRVLAGCIDFLCKLNEPDPSVRSFERSDCCVSATLRGGPAHGTVSRPDPQPSRVLALSNLVKDRFTFDRGRRGEEENPDRFYHYLGVRQATNLTTTGAMDRIVADAILTVLTDQSKRDLLYGWIGRIFPQFDLAIGFYNLSTAAFERFLHDPQKFIQGRIGSARRISEEYLKNRVIPHMELMKRLLSYLLSWKQGGDAGFRTSQSGRSKVTAVGLSDLNAKMREELVFLSQSFDVARQLRLLNGPIMLLRDIRQPNSSWIEFSNLSSGEQNLLSTGARLIAHSVPESFIVIDEPELSLNVAWQQRYMELVGEALSLARGSHVLIATHSPHLVSNLKLHESSVVVAERHGDDVKYKSHKGEFFGWGSEAILYKVLDIPAASNFEFSREVAEILLHIQRKGKDRKKLDVFLGKCRRLEMLGGDKALAEVVEEISSYRATLNK